LYLYRVKLIFGEMKLWERVKICADKATRKHQITLHDDGEERWSADISPLKLTTICVAVVTLIFGVLLLFVAYTPILDLLPGYRTNAAQSREELIRNIVRLDSLERKLNDMLTYNENRILVVNGKTPALQSVQKDSLEKNKGFVAPSKADSLLRQKMQNDERYRLNEAGATASLNGVAPMYGMISERFNAKTLLGIRMNGAKAAQVSAVADGVVISKEWAPEVGHSVVIQHKDSYISIYRNLAEVFAAKGERVKGSQVIGTAGGKEENKSVLEFELWRDGSALNPELYIIF
jgi:murein DD-endopeptidase MepM/ murein hydrolase activator NlpD